MGALTSHPGTPRHAPAHFGGFLHNLGPGRLGGGSAPGEERAFSDARSVEFFLIWAVLPDMIFQPEFIGNRVWVNTTRVYLTLVAEMKAPHQTPWDAQARSSPLW